MVALVTDLRAREWGQCAFGIWIQGLPYVWVTEHHNDELLGGGGVTWIKRSEDNIGDTSARTVLAGLVMPSALPRGAMDLQTGLPQQTQATFEIIDVDGVLGDLLASEGKDYDLLAEKIPAGSTALGTSVAVNNKSGTTNPRGKHIGIEKIGPSGERNHRHVLPIDWIGPEHAFGETTPGLRISTDPLDFEGRWVAVFRLYRDPDATLTAGGLAYPLWGEQYDAGGLEFLGKLTGRGEIRGDTWKITCTGVESLLKRTFGANTPVDPLPVNESVLVLGEEEKGISLRLGYHDWEAPGNPVVIFESSAFFSDLSSTGDALFFLNQINEFIDNVKAGGALTNYGSGVWQDWLNSNFFLTDTGAQIKRKVDAAESGPVFAELVLHRKVWRYLGWEPTLQASPDTANPNGEYESGWKPYTYHVNFEKLEPGDKVAAEAPDQGMVPTSDYWKASFSTIVSGGFFGVGMDDDNDGNAKVFKSYYGKPVHAIYPGATFRCFASSIRMPSDPLVPRLNTSEVGGSQCNAQRYIAFKGKIVAGDAQGVALEGTEPREFVQVGRVSWRSTGVDDGVTEPDGFAEFFLEKWEDPRLFGYPYPPLSGEWAFEGDELSITMHPLFGWAYVIGGPDRGHRVLSALLRSTGTADGYDDGLDGTPEFQHGEAHVAGYMFGGDVTQFDCGLAIPNDLLESANAIKAAFDESIPSGWESPLNKVRHVYSGGIESFRVIESITRPRGMMLTFRNRKFGVKPYAPPTDYDYTITESSMATIEPPEQALRATGAIDKIELSYRWDPVAGSLAAERSDRALDPGAGARRGDLKADIEDYGLIPVSWKAPNCGDWLPDWLQLWAKDRAKFLARPHFLVKCKLNVLAGQDLWMGSQILFTNPWCYQHDGTRGITNAFALVVDCVGHPNVETYDVTLLVFAEQAASKYWYAPIAKIRGWSGTTVYVNTDWWNHGGDTLDAQGFKKPAWSTSGGTAQGRVLYWDLGSWNLSTAFDVTNVSDDGSQVTISAMPSAVKRDMDCYLIFGTHADQAGAWPVDHYAIVVNDDGEGGSGNAAGKPFID